MNIQIEIINFDDIEEQKLYDNLISESKCSFIQQTSFWGNVIKDISPDKPYFLIAKENGKWIGGLNLFLYSNSMGNILTSNPHAGSIGSISVHPDVADPKKVYKSLLDYAVKLAHELDCITLTVTTNPFLNDSDLFYNYLKPETGMETFIQVIWLNEFFNDQGNTGF